MLYHILPCIALFYGAYCAFRDAVIRAYLSIFSGVCSYSPDLICCHFGSFSATTLISSRFPDNPVSVSRNMLPYLSALDFSYHCCTNAVRFGYIWVGAGVFQDLRHNLISQLGRRIVRTLRRFRVGLIASLFHHVPSVVFIRPLENVTRVVAKTNITGMAGKHAFRHFSSVICFPCDAVGSSRRTIPAVGGNRPVSLLGVSGPKPAFIGSSDVSLKPDLTGFRAVTSFLFRKGLVAVKAKPYFPISHSATPVQCGFGQVCHGMTPVTDRFSPVAPAIKPNFTGLPQSGGQPGEAHWERIAAAASGNRETGNCGQAVLEGLMQPIWHRPALSSRVNLTTASLAMREPPDPIQTPPVGDIGGSSLSLSLSLSA